MTVSKRELSPSTSTYRIDVINMSGAHHGATHTGLLLRQHLVQSRCVTALVHGVFNTLFTQFNHVRCLHTNGYRCHATWGDETSEKGGKSGGIILQKGTHFNGLIQDCHTRYQTCARVLTSFVCLFFSQNWHIFFFKSKMDQMTIRLV